MKNSYNTITKYTWHTKNIPSSPSICLKPPYPVTTDVICERFQSLQIFWKSKDTFEGGDWATAWFGASFLSWTIQCLALLTTILTPLYSIYDTLSGGKVPYLSSPKGPFTYYVRQNLAENNPNPPLVRIIGKPLSFLSDKLVNTIEIPENQEGPWHLVPMSQKVRLCKKPPLSPCSWPNMWTIPKMSLSSHRLTRVLLMNGTKIFQTSPSPEVTIILEWLWCCLCLLSGAILNCFLTFAIFTE